MAYASRGKTQLKRRRFALSGLFAAVLALAAQLAGAALVPVPALAAMEYGVICHSDGKSAPKPAPIKQRIPDGALCPLWLSAATPAPTLSAPPPVPPPSVAQLTPVAWQPPLRGPPPLPRSSIASPRGPPTSV